MANYESTFICSPDLPTEKLDELVEKAKKTIENAGGTIKLTQQLGKKKLAYPINKFRDGSYVYFELTGTGEMINALENFYKVNDAVIRFLTVKVEKKKPAPRPAAEPAPTASATPTAPAEATSQEVKPNEQQSSAPGAK